MRCEALVALVLAGCSSTNFLEKDYAARCVAQVSAKLGDDPRAIDIDVQADRVNIVAIDPADDTRPIRWQCRSKGLDGPRAAQLPDEPLAQVVFKLGDFDFTRVPRMLESAAAQGNQPFDRVEARVVEPPMKPRGPYFVLHGTKGFTPAYAPSDGTDVWVSTRIINVH